MHWSEIFVLSTFEILSVLLVWNKLNSKLCIKSVKGVAIIMASAILTAILFIYKINFSFLINFIVLCGLAIALFKLSFRETLLHFFVSLSVVTSIQFSFTYMLSLFIDTMVFSFINGLIVNVATFSSCILINKFMNFDKIHQYIAKYKNYVTMISINITGIVLLLIYIWEMNKELVWNYISILLLAIFIWIGLNMFFLYQSIRIQQQQKVLVIHRKYTPFLNSMVHEVRQRQHDFKNHLSVLYGLLEIEDDHQAKAEIKEYIESIMERINPTDKLLNIKDHTLSAIIYSKKSLAEEKRISFNIEFLEEIPEYPLEKYELVELLGNLLDNAIEAAEDSQSIDKSQIILTLGTENNFKIIEIKNTLTSPKEIDVDHIFQRGFSTKEGKHRGYGLYNVKKIVDYYNGTIELSFGESYIVFKILL